ncbi:hypothetical protein GYMLUDRAFT_734761 [Collybiopsis luxurians FD-317 M1]|nr:hypothetical protein GYMLUDRAFT_734761 [Collybiopsis luxurians FD-317 M1]
MKYFQLGGWNPNRPRWDDNLSKASKKFNDHKKNAEKVFNALTNSFKSKSEYKSKSEDYVDNLEEEDGIKLTLGILRSGASVLLLTWDQVSRICSAYSLPRPRPHEEIDSSRFESLAPVEFIDSEELAAKLRVLEPKPLKGRSLDRDTSQANKAYALASIDPIGGEEPEGLRRGLFENVRVLRQIVYGQRLIPPPPPTHSPNDLYPPYVQFALRQNINLILAGRGVHLAAFAYTLWAQDLNRQLENRERSPDVLQVAWARTRDGFNDLQVLNEGDSAGSQVEFGWNSYKTQPRMKSKEYPKTIKEPMKSSLVGERLIDNLLQLKPRSENSSKIANDSEVEHLFLLVHDEPRFRALFLDLGVNLLKGSSGLDSFDEAGGSADGSGQESRKWTYSYGTEVQSEFPGSSRYANGNYRRDPRDRNYSPNRYGSDGYSNHTNGNYASSSSSLTFSGRRAPGSYSSLSSNDFQSNGRNQSEYLSSFSGNGGPNVGVKREQRDDDPRAVKREQREDELRAAKRQKMHDGHREQRDDDEEGVYDTTSEEDEIEDGEVSSSSLHRKMKKEEDKDTKPNPQQSPASTKIHIHALDLQTLFTVSTGAAIGAQHVQDIARELQKGFGGVQLHGQLEETEYSAGWDAELMLAIFGRLMDGDSVDDQKSSASGRRAAQREEEEELRKLRREEQEREQRERGSGTANSSLGGLSEAWEDYGEDDDD